MRIKKRLLCPERVRRVPNQFSWIDQRLVREHYMERCTTHALALYLFLLTVGDAEGLSFYSDSTIAKLISLDVIAVQEARRVLISAELIAYQAPLFQVLSLNSSVPRRRANGPASIGEILKAGGVR